MELKKRFLASIFFKTSGLVNKGKKLLFYIILLDIFFIVSLSMLKIVFGTLNFAPTSVQQTYYLLFLAIIYYLGFLFFYSFFKYLILFFVQSTISKKRPILSFNRIGKFYLLNLVVFLILFLVFFVLSALASSIQEGIAPFTSLFILLFYFIFAYAFVNISHVSFSEGEKVWQSFRLGVKSLGRFKYYYGVYITIILSFAIIFLLFTTFGNILKFTVFQNYNALSQYGDIYTIIFVHAVGIIFYIAILFNRFYFYNIVKEKFLK